MSATFKVIDRSWLEEFVVDHRGRVCDRQEVEDEDDLRSIMRESNRRGRASLQPSLGILVATGILVAFAVAFKAWIL